MQSLRQKPMGYPKWSYLVPRNLFEPLLGSLEPLEPSPGTLNWNLGTFGTFTRNPYLHGTWNLPKSYPYLGPPSRTFTRNSYLEARNLSEPLLGTLEPTGSFTWNSYLESWNFLNSSLGTLPEPLPGTLAWNLGTSRNLAGWLPQSGEKSVR